MTYRLHARSLRRTCAAPLTLIAAACALLATPVLAQEPATTPPASVAAPAENATEELIQLLWRRNALSEQEARVLLERLRKEQAGAAPDSPPDAAPGGRIRVPYLPESERRRLREQLKASVMETARAENWAQPNTLPDWLKRIRIAGDLRLREELVLMDPDNDPFFVNFQAINTGSPYNVGQPQVNQLAPPLLNTTQDRTAFRVRARLDLDAQINDRTVAALHFSTGNSTNPVSTNQTLANDFNKLSFVIDRAYLGYESEDYGETSGLAVWGGRIPNPYMSTELLWDDDLNFDGIAARARADFGGAMLPFITLGGFAVENTAFDFPSNNPDKAGSRDVWLLAAQVGVDWRLRNKAALSASAAYVRYIDIEGKTSAPCLAPTTAFSCDSDDSRPSFVQKGNTLYAVRNLQLAVAGDPEFQYFGLATPFRLLNINVLADWEVAGPIHLVFAADYVRNLAYEAHRVRGKLPVNNYEPGRDTDNDGVEDVAGPYKGGDTGYLAQLRVGHTRIAARGDWNIGGGYRRLESDAVVDAFTDSDFHLGGTNAKGLSVSGNIGVAKNTSLGLRYFSATEVSGPPLSIDVLQLDLSARF